MRDLVGVRSGQAPLGLITVAGLTPPDIEVELQDENCYPLQLDTDAEVVAIGCWNVQYARARELAAEFRRRGKLVVVGGPYPTLCPERFEDGTFDVVFDGEVELTWPEFCRDLMAGAPKPLYKQVGNIDISRSPKPRFDLLRTHDYLYHFIQTTRGCPFQCEFCDIIVTDGRVPRTKPIAQVMAEIEAVAESGGRYVSFSDANFIGNMKYAEQLLHALVEFGRRRNFPITFSAEMTVTVAEKPQLLTLMREANFTSIFLGIESPRLDSLVETKKRQNVAKPLIDSVRRIQSENLMVVAGMIVGFDHDDTRIFQEQFDFLMEAGIGFTTCGVLTAIEKTPLHARLKKEGRLLPYDSAAVLGHGAADLNFVPKRMTVEEVLQGYNWLIRALYKYENYGARLVTAVRQYRPRPDLKGRMNTRFDWHLVPIALKVARHFLLTRDRARRRFFVSSIRSAMKSEPTLEKFLSLVAYVLASKHFHEYVTATHGDPEAVTDVSPFTDEAPVRDWWRGDMRQEFVRAVKRRLYLGGSWLAWLKGRPRRVVAVPEAVLTEKIGECLRRYLNELGVEVVPVATAALSRLRDRVDVLVLPILGSARKGREELQQLVQQLQEKVHADWGRLPRIVHVSLDGDRRAVLESFARIGLTFTRRIEQLREAYDKAIESVVTSPTQPVRPQALKIVS
jgi:radical SAM superfamily enzyme YgiQ (UPF0313 family)